MSPKKLAIFLGIAVFLLGFIGTAGAIQIDPLAVDFRNKDNWGAAHGTDDFTYDDIQVKADTDHEGGYLTWSTSGMGIKGGEIDDDPSEYDLDPRIDGDDDGDDEQEFKVRFLVDDPVMFDKLWLTGFEGDEDDLELELDGSGKSLSGRVTRDGGVAFIDLSGFKFNKLDIEGDDPSTKFFVAGFSKAGEGVIKSGIPVSEPATMLLLGVGLIGLAGFGRKKILK